MRVLKRILTVFAVLAMCLSLCPSSLAAGKYEYKDKSWEDVLQQVMDDCQVTEDMIAVGYLNLATGEEHYLNGDRYLTAASMYKLPLNMYYAELIGSGELDWDSNFPNLDYEYVRDESLIYSNNELSMFLYECSFMGNYQQFRTLTAPYMGVDPENPDQEYLGNNVYTPRQFIQCLKLLYNEQERFPGIIETMQKAEIQRFFMMNEPRFKIAHKYGYITDENGVTFMNDCGLAFTAEPIAIVMFTVNVFNAEETLTAYCTAMCEYTEYQTALAAVTPTPEPTAAPEPVSAPAPSPAEFVEPAPEQASPLVPCAFIALFLLLGLVAIIVLKIRYKAKFIPLFLSLLLCGGTMLLAVFGLYKGTVFAKTDGEPVESVELFFDALIAGDYSTAYKQLEDYTTLGLENPPQSAAGQRMHQALLESYSYEIIGEGSVDRLEAKETVRFTHLDIPSLEDEIAALTQDNIKEIVQNRPNSQVYDQNNNYLPEVTEEAYLKALDTVLSKAEEHYISSDIELRLNYVDGAWKMLTNGALLKALNGATGY